MVGGDGHFDFSWLNNKVKLDEVENDMGETTAFQFTPQVGIFVEDGLAVGLSLPISVASTTDDGDQSTLNSIVAAPFGRYYFNLAESPVKPYIHGEAGFGRMKIEYGTFENKMNLYHFAAGAGIGWFVNDFVSVDAGLKYRNEITKYEDADQKDKMQGINFNVGFTIVF